VHATRRRVVEIDRDARRVVVERFSIERAR
jgi:hypothetical protein